MAAKQRKHTMTMNMFVAVIADNLTLNALHALIAKLIKVYLIKKVEAEQRKDE